MIYRFTEVLNDLVNYFLLGDILLLEDWKQANHLSDDLAMEFTTNESGDRVFDEGIVIPMAGIENYPYTILFNLSGDRPELCKERNRLQLRKSGYSLKVDHNMLMLFTWPILEQFTPEKVKDLISYYHLQAETQWWRYEIRPGRLWSCSGKNGCRCLFSHHRRGSLHKRSAIGGSILLIQDS